MKLVFKIIALQFSVSLTEQFPTLAGIVVLTVQLSNSLLGFIFFLHCLDAIFCEQVV